MKSSARKKRTCQPIKWTSAQKLLAVMREEAEAHPRFARDRLLFAIGFYTGLRISDILALTPIVLLEDLWEIKEKKTGKIRQIEINPSLRKHIKHSLKYMRLEDYHDFIFVGTRGPSTGKPMAIENANQIIRSTFKRHDIKAAHPTSHTLRKTFGRRVYEFNGRSEDALVLLSKMFNHRSIQETREYIGLTRERIISAYVNI